MAENQWYILIGQERQGPMSATDVRYLLTRRSIDAGTLVWREGMDSWERLREIDEFKPKGKSKEPEQEREPEPTPPPPSAEPSRILQRIIPALLTLGLIGGAVYVFVTDDTPDRESPRAASNVKRKRTQRSPQELIDQLKRGERGSKTDVIRAGSRAVPALIQALLDKGSPINPNDIRAILIEIGPSSSEAIGEALEGLDLPNAAQIILVEVLGEFGGLTSVPALIVALGTF